MSRGRGRGRHRALGAAHLPARVGMLAVCVAVVAACGQGRSNAPLASAGGNDGGSSPASGTGGSSGGGNATGGSAAGGRSPSAGSSGAPAGGGGSQGAGAPAAGGVVSGEGAAPGAGGAPVGGEAGDATQPPEGGAPAGGGAGSSGASAGTAGAGGSRTPSPSAGCALATATLPNLANLSGFQLRLRASTDAYDGVTPMPLLLVFHATSQLSAHAELTNDQAVVERYVVAAPEAPDLWSFDQVSVNDATALLDELRAKLCLDESRLFVVGNGSGGRFMLGWLGARDRAGASPRVRAAAMVGTYIRQSQALGLPLPLLFLHAISSANSDAVAGDPDGTRALGAFRTFNQCGETSTPMSLAGCETMGMTVDPGCVDFQGCAEALRFCHHDSPDGSGDLWPCFGSRAIVEFFESI